MEEDSGEEDSVEGGNLPGTEASVQLVVIVTRIIIMGCYDMWCVRKPT